jgi:hypothetical protein
MAQRVINTPLRQFGALGLDIRFGLNAVCNETRDIVNHAVQTDFLNAVVIDSPVNLHKYPMMRNLIRSRPILAPYFMWFDDDSCIAPDTDIAIWTARLDRHMQTYAAIGSIHKTRYVGNQIEWIKAQSWYNGKEPGQYVQFAAGGWWLARSDILSRLDWPPRAFKHRGGDVMFGELLRQHDLPLGHFRDNLWINANESGIESQSTRRGELEMPIGYDYIAQPQNVITQHEYNHDTH